MCATSWSIYVTLSSVAVIMVATSSFGCSDNPRLSASRQRNLLMGNSHRFYQGTALGLSLAGHAYRNTTARSYALCSVSCLLSDECKSFNYCMDNKLCQLNSAVYSENEDTLLESSGCLYFDESLHEALPCQVYATKGDIKFKKVMLMPVHLEFVVVSNGKVDVEFEANEQEFDVELQASSLFIKAESENDNKIEEEINLLATRVVIDLNKTHITVGKKGIRESEFSLTYPAITDTSLTLEIESEDANAIWTFYNPCEINLVPKVCEQ